MEDETDRPLVLGIVAVISGVLLVGLIGRLIGPENIEVTGTAGVLAGSLFVLSISLATWTRLYPEQDDWN